MTIVRTYRSIPTFPDSSVWTSQAYIEETSPSGVSVFVLGVHHDQVFGIGGGFTAKTLADRACQEAEDQDGGTFESNNNDPFEL